MLLYIHLGLFGNQDEDDADEEDEEDLEANLKEEFPFEEDDDLENIETEEAATQRLELEIENQFLTDEKNLSAVMVGRRHKFVCRVLVCLILLDLCSTRKASANIVFHNWL